jgi:type IV secretory pathway TrbD component
LALFQGLGMLYGISFIVPGVLFIVVLWVARSLHKADPDMVDVWQRAMKYRHYYPAKSHIGVPHPEVKRFTK